MSFIALMTPEPIGHWMPNSWPQYRPRSGFGKEVLALRHLTTRSVNDIRLSWLRMRWYFCYHLCCCYSCCCYHWCSLYDFLTWLLTTKYAKYSHKCFIPSYFPYSLIIINLSKNGENNGFLLKVIQTDENFLKHFWLTFFQILSLR